MIKVEAVCISEEKGTPKRNIQSCEFIEDHGLKNDAHAGKWHRQVSLLSKSVIDGYRSEFGSVPDGAFGENLILSGCRVERLAPGSVITIGDTILEVTQIGKECHTGCSIQQRTGKCIMPQNGVFARVVKGGIVSVGDTVSIREKFTAAAVTVSDRASAGEYEDISGKTLAELLETDGFTVTERVIVPDETDVIRRELERLSQKSDLVITTGGTGFSERDNTPEATAAAADKDVPGIAEAIRAASMRFTPKAMLGRGRSVIRGRCLIINFPGSPKAVRESYDIIRPAVKHGIGILKGTLTE